MEGTNPSNHTSTLYEGTDDCGAPGVGSIPQLLRSARALMHTHSDQLIESLDGLAAKSLSTVMGTFISGRMKRGAVKTAIKSDCPKLTKIINAYEQNDDEVCKQNAADARGELQVLVESIADHQDQQFTSRLPAEMAAALADDVVEPIKKSVKEHIARARAFTLQAITLYSGVNTGAPFRREAAAAKFDAQVKFLVQKLTSIKEHKERLEECRSLCAQITANTSITEILNDSEQSSKLKQCEGTMATITQSISSLSKDLIAEFRKEPLNTMDSAFKT